MISDIRSRAPGTALQTEVCIIGGGAAGITLALSLESQGINCTLLESGGTSLESGIQDLYATVRGNTVDAQACRLRYFGGTTNHWGGYCAPLNEQDFELRSWVPHSGWPITRSELLPYYERAQQICGLASFAYTCETIGVRTDRYLRFGTDKIVPRFYQFSTPPLRFGTAYADRLRRSPLVDVLLYGNVLSLSANTQASHVDEALLGTLDGWRGSIRARRFVLACGAIENARLLLLSDQVQREGLGNASGNVGRYFMQHPHVADTELAISDPETVERLFGSFQQNGVTFRASIGPCAPAQQRNRILNCSATMHTPHQAGSGAEAAFALARDLKRGRWPDNSGEKLARVITDLDSVVARLARGPGSGFVWLRAEQAPNPDSRIMLSEQQDALGQRRARVDWRLTALDKRSLRVSAHLIAEELGRLGVGRMRLPLWLVDDEADWPEGLWGGCHHMGGTRMSSDPADGVVDADCRVHGIDNLFVAGSSVFPTSGYANPTLTICALASRLGDHLARARDRAFRVGPNEAAVSP